MFEDMPEYGTPEHEAIDWAYTHDPQITAGMSATAFGTGETLTRAQAATFLLYHSERTEENHNLSKKELIIRYYLIY